MKIVTVLGTRPELIRLALVMERLDGLCDHVLVHTGQNYTESLNDWFFQELGIRKPAYALGIQGASMGEQIGQILAQCESVFRKEKPDRLLILGDTNSALAAVMAKRMGIPVFHMEAGNRCYDDRVPEEVNRRIIDHCSDLLMPYTERSRANLLKEGIAGHRIVVTGNPILEVIERHAASIEASGVLSKLGLSSKGYFLVTLHRAENVDIEERLANLVLALDRVQRTYGLPVIVSTHPRTRSKLQGTDLVNRNPQVRFLDPFGFFDFVHLEKQAACVLSDSGTVQEECCLFKVPNVTLRDVTERPETVECGSNLLAGADPECILRCVAIAMASSCQWSPPQEYLRREVSETVVRVVLGYHHH